MTTDQSPESNPQGSYQFEALESRHHEATMLAERAQMRLDGFIPLLKRHGLGQPKKILEVGCGQGIRARLMAENFPQSEVIGIDRSQELLESARQNEPPSNLSFAAADLYQLPFADNHFDFVYARLVFMHLTEPAKALTEILRVLRPGGRLLIEDADRDCMFFEPAPESFADFWRKVQDGQRRLGGDPNIGRKLASLFTVTGFHQTRIETQPITGGGDDIAFLVRTLMPSLNLYLTEEDRPLGQAAIDDLVELSLQPHAAFYHFWFTVSGEKP